MMYEFLSTTKGLAQYIMSRLVRQFFWHAVILLSFVTVTGNLSAQQQSVEGFGKEVVEIDYPFNGVPLLQDFYLRFSSDDRHIALILVDPLRISNKITLGYLDNSRNDEFFYKAAHQIIPGTGVQINELVFFPKGKEKLPIVNPGPDFELILIGFDFQYRGTDHHIDEVGVLQEDENTLTAFFNDKNDDDPALVRIRYAWVPKSSIESTGVETGTSRGGDRRSIPNGIRVIRGFKVNYTSSDHHLTEIGVLTTLTTSGDLEVYYSDKNQDDQFDWEIRWAILKPQ